MATAIPYIGAATGLFSLYQSAKQGDQQASLQKQALSASKASELYPNMAKKSIYDLASAYDPAKEAAPAVSAAQDSASKALAAALSGNKAKFSAAGGVPGGDTALSMRNVESIANYTDPLKTFVAGLLADASMKKINALSQVFNGGSGSQTASLSASMAQGINPDYGAGLSLFSQSLAKLTQKSSSFDQRMQKAGVQLPDSTNPFYR